MAQQHATLRLHLLGQHGDAARASSDGADGDIEAILKRDRDMQEQITQSMLEMARAIKEKSQLTSAIVAADRRTLDTTEKLAETGLRSFRGTTQRLEKHIEHSSTLWMWLALLLACIVFVIMALFIRLFPA